MKKKLNLTRVIIVLLIMTAIIMLIIIAVAGNNNSNNNNNNSKPSKISESHISVNSQYDDMIIKDVSLHYNEQAESTNINFKIENTSNEDLAYESVIIVALDENNNILSSIEQIIGFLEAKGQYLVNATLRGNLEQQVKKLELQKPIE